MRQVPAIGLIVAALLLAADQLVKWTVTGPLGLDEMADARPITGFFNLRFVPNHGISLGLFRADSDAQRWAIVALTALIAVGVLVWMSRETKRWDRIALGLVLGGAIGNILDRVRLGYVVDYADLHFGEWRPFLVFNVADAAITIGVVVLVARALLVKDKPAGAAAVENGNA